MDAQPLRNLPTSRLNQFIIGSNVNLAHNHSSYFQSFLAKLLEGVFCSHSLPSSPPFPSLIHIPPPPKFLLTVTNELLVKTNGFFLTVILLDLPCSI